MLYLSNHVKLASDLEPNEHINLAGLIYRIQEKRQTVFSDVVELDLMLSMPTFHSVATLDIPAKAMITVIDITNRLEYSQE